MRSLSKSFQILPAYSVYSIFMVLVVNKTLNFSEVKLAVVEAQSQAAVAQVCTILCKRQITAVKIIIVVIQDEQRTRTLTLITWRWRRVEVGVSSRLLLALTWVPVNNTCGLTVRFDGSGQAEQGGRLHGFTSESGIPQTGNPENDMGRSWPIRLTQARWLWSLWDSVVRGFMLRWIIMCWKGIKYVKHM